MPVHEHEAAVELTVNLNGEFHLHHHHHHGSNPSQPGAADIINLIRDSKEAIMTQLSDAIATLTADDAQLESEINEVLTKLAQVPGEIAAAVQKALDDAGVDAATARDAVIAIDTGVKEAIAKVTAALAPAPPPPVDSPLLVDTSGFSDGQVGAAYTGSLAISGGTGPYSVQVDTPTVSGLTMDSNGAVTGTPDTEGSVSFSGTVADSATPNAHQTFSVSFSVAAAPV